MAQPGKAAAWGSGGGRQFLFRNIQQSAALGGRSTGVCLSVTENGMGPMKNVKDKNETNVLPDSLAWDAMIRDAKKRIEELKLAIELFEKKKAAGERWPGAQSEDQDAV